MDPIEPLALFKSYLQSHGQHVTRARIKIASEVFQIHEHFDASGLWKRLSAERIAQATIYRTLDLLCQAGLVRKMELEGRAIFEVVLGRPRHEHLICIRCQAITEFQDALLEERFFSKTEELHYQPVSHQLLLLGVCPACQNASPVILKEPEKKPTGL